MKRHAALLAGLIVILTLIVYGLNLPKEFVGWDLGAYEPVLYANNPVSMSERLLEDFKGRIVPGYYAPVSSISLMLDKYLIGSQVPSPRITAFLNLAIHCVNGVLLLLLLRFLGARETFCVIAVFVFLLHPVQVAGVIWFAQRKTVLGAMFCLLSWLSFLAYRRRGSGALYLSSLVSFGLSLLAKPTFVVFPAILLATDILLSKDAPLRASGEEAEDSASRFLDLIHRPRVLLQFVPFGVLALGVALIAMATEPTKSLVFPWYDRLFVVATAFWFYVGKILAPLNLTVVYPRWHVDYSSWLWWVPPIGLAVAGLLLAIFRRRVGNRTWWALAVFVIPLIPAIGFFKFGHQRFSFVANHFLYFSMIGAGCLFALFAEQALAHLPPVPKKAFAVIGAVYLGLFVVQTAHRTSVWNNTYALWSDNLRHNPSSVSAHLILGQFALGRGHLRRAEEYFRKTLQIDPDNAIAYNNLGLIRKQQRRYAEAEHFYRKALAFTPGLTEAVNNLARVLDATGKLPAAIDLYRRALAQKPDSPPILLNLGNALVRARRIPEAIVVYNRIVDLGGGSAAIQNDLGVLYVMSGKPARAIQHFKTALRLNPSLSDARANLASALKEITRPRQSH